MSNQYPPPPPPGGQDPNQPGQPPAGDVPPPPPGAPGTPPSYGGGYPPPAPPPGQYAGQPPGYPPAGAPGGYGAAEPKNNALAIVALVTGILGVVCCPVAVFSIAALVCGFLGRKQIEESPATQKGSGMAMAGIILGAVGLVITVVYYVLIAVGSLNYNFSTAP